MRKVADVIAEILAQHVKHVFAISGGASLHMIHGIAARSDIALVCPQNEQAASFQADCYARLTGFGCALVTSGPGATNLITGIASSYYDSVPVLYITGQQVRARMKGDSALRQLGFQETPIVPMVNEITKYAATIMEARHVPECLATAIRVAKEGRPGPVLLDIPDDIQREQIDA